MQAQLDTTTPLRFKPAPKNWRGKAQLVSNSRALTMRMWRSMIFCRLDMLLSQQGANQGGNGLLRAYQPRAEAARAIDIKPIWRARTSEQLQAALDDAQTAMFQALDGNDPQKNWLLHACSCGPNKLANAVGDPRRTHRSKASEI
jgi:hypothetical protein